MSIIIRFGTFNCGAGYGDYRSMVSADPKEAEKLLAKINEAKPTNEQESFDIQDSLQETIEKVVAEKLANQLDVICLQELKTEGRAFYQSLIERGFSIYRLEQIEGKQIPLENAVAIRNGVFEKVENRSIASQSFDLGGRGKAEVSFKQRFGGYGKQIASVIATIAGNMTLSFTSMHSWGFQLYAEHESRPRRVPAEEVTRQKQSVAYHKEATENAAQQNASLMTVIAGDLNNAPDKYLEPFTHMENAGYTVHEPDEETNVNYSEELKYRKIDYIFTSEKQASPTQSSFFRRMLTKITSIFYVSAPILTYSTPKVLEGFDFTVETNCSDHKPVGMTINVTYKSSIARLWEALFGVKQKRA